MTTPTLLEVQGLVKHFPLKKDVFGRGGGVVRAVEQRRTERALGLREPGQGDVRDAEEGAQRPRRGGDAFGLQGA